MTTKELATAVMNWVVEVLPEIEGSYDHATDERTQGLPDVAVEVTDWRITQGMQDARLRKISQIQQQNMKVWDLEVLLIVEPDPPDTAEDSLKDFTDRLGDRLLQDPSLGQRVEWTNTNPRVGFRPPFVEFDDGTRGRIAIVYMQVGQLVEVS